VQHDRVAARHLRAPGHSGSRPLRPRSALRPR
jgi:hypothetical protein